MPDIKDRIVQSIAQRLRLDFNKLISYQEYESNNTMYAVGFIDIIPTKKGIDLFDSEEVN